MKKFLKSLIAISLLATMLIGCSDGDSSVSSTESQTTTPTTENVVEPIVDNVEEVIPQEYGTVTIDNFNQTIEFTEVPQNVISLNLNTAEIVVALGGGDSINGVSTGNFSFDDISDEYSNEFSSIDAPEVINSGIPTLEGMLSLNADLVIANSYYFNVPFFGTLDDYKTNGTQFFIPEGSYVTNATIENTYTDIENLGKIFNNEDKANDIITDMKATVSLVKDKVADVEPVSVMYVDSINEDGQFIICGGVGLIDNFIELASGENIFSDIDSQFTPVSVEEIIDRNPSVIIFSDYTYLDDDIENNINYVTNSNELSNIDAVVNEKFYTIPQYVTFPSMQNAEAVEMLASFLYPDLF